jgi:hypothetical protein
MEAYSISQTQRERKLLVEPLQLPFDKDSLVRFV